jgi:hypothetical protein
MYSEAQLSSLAAAIFVVLVTMVIGVSIATGLRPRTARQRAVVWGVFVYLAWALLGFGLLRSG